MIKDLEKSFEMYIKCWRDYIINYGVDNVIVSKDKRIEYNYHFEIVNGAFRNETIKFNFQYFRKLEHDELMKFIFRSLCSHESNWYFKNEKFNKRMIVY